MVVPGKIVEIAAQSGGWLQLNCGESVRIIDVDGAQVADMFAVSASDMTEYLSVSTTRAGNYRMFPQLGDYFLSNRYQPMLAIKQDDSPGVHDMLYAACSSEMYAAMGVKEYHPNCSDNFRKAAISFNWNPEVVPDPVNLFQNTRIIDGIMKPLSALTKAGDSITLQAVMDLYLIVTACSMDLEPINGDKCSRIRMEIITAAC